jgi:hypothetical protein
LILTSTIQDKALTSPLALPTIDDTIEYWNKLVLRNDDQERAREQNVRLQQGACYALLDKLEAAIHALQITKLEVPACEPKLLGASSPGDQNAATM